MLGAHTLAEIAVEGHLHVGAQLRIEFAVEAAAAKQGTDTRGQGANLVGHEVALSTRLITVAI